MKIEWEKGKRGGQVIRCSLRCKIPDLTVSNKPFYQITAKGGKITFLLFGTWISNYKRMKCWADPDRAIRAYVSKKLKKLARQLPQRFYRAVPEDLLKEWLALHLSESTERKLAARIREIAHEELLRLSEASQRLERKADSITDKKNDD